MDRPKVGVGVIVVDPTSEKVLMQKRKGAHGEGHWSFPGGHLEGGESPKHCAIRELYEETGLIIRPSDCRCTTFTNDVFVDEEKHYFTLYVQADLVDQSMFGVPEIREPWNCSAMGWFRWDKLPTPLFLPVQNLLIQGYNPFICF